MSTSNENETLNIEYLLRRVAELERRNASLVIDNDRLEEVVRLQKDRIEGLESDDRSNSNIIEVDENGMVSYRK